MIRTRRLETTQITLPSGRVLTVPTGEETLRITGFLIVRRNQTRDYLDVAALADRYGIQAAAGVLARIDDYYADQHGEGRGVAARLVRQLARRQAFVVGETNGTWGTAEEVAGTAALNRNGRAVVLSVSCAAAGRCSADGSYLDGSGRPQAFVVNET